MRGTFLALAAVCIASSTAPVASAGSARAAAAPIFAPPPGPSPRLTGEPAIEPAIVVQPVWYDRWGRWHPPYYQYGYGPPRGYYAYGPPGPCWRYRYCHHRRVQCLRYGWC